MTIDRVVLAFAGGMVLASLALGTTNISDRPLLGAIGTVAPCLVYGLVIRFIDRERRASERQIKERNFRCSKRRTDEEVQENSR